ncbi:hypothetical protein V8C42DRAFT_274537 [Trichoderma barbatum]
MDSGGWQTVKTNSRRRRPELPPPSRDPSQTRRVPHLTSEEIMKDWKLFSGSFLASRCATALKKIVMDYVEASYNHDDPTPVTSAVCLGIGSFDPPDGNWLLKRRAHVQLIALHLMVELLRAGTYGADIKCFFQEPAFTEGDKKFLTGFGHTICESPIASNMVDHKTLFFGPHLYKDVYASALAGPLPAIWVGTGWDIWASVAIRSTKEEDELLLGIRLMEELYAKVQFPDDVNDSTTFHGTSIYFNYPQTVLPSVESDVPVMVKPEVSLQDLTLEKIMQRIRENPAIRLFEARKDK